MTEHPQLDLDGTSVDEGMSVFIQLVWSRGLKTCESCQGGGPTPETALAYILFPAVGDAAEFLLHAAHITNYQLGDRIALTIQHPVEDATCAPQGKVTWMPELTPILTKAWV